MFQYLNILYIEEMKKKKHIYLEFHNNKLINIIFINFFKKFHKIFLILIIT